MRAFLDTNIFLYAAGTDHPLRASCQDILHWCSRGILEATTNAEVVQEILYVLHRRGEVAGAPALSRHILNLYPNLIAVTHTDMLQACNLLAKYPNLPVRDAVHAATALNNDIQNVISADRHFDQIENLHRVDPLDVAKVWEL